MIEVIEQQFEKHKKTWESVRGKVFEYHPDYKVGDLIQLSAIYKYLKTKKIEIKFCDFNENISMMEIFPDNLVTYVKKNNGLPQLDLVGMWNWSPFLQANKFYTENQVKYDNSKIEFDCVFIPYIKPFYYFERELKNPEEIFQEILKNYPNSICVIDSNKKQFFKMKDNRVVYSDNLHTTFKYIEKSKYYVGCDTGTTHYAGSINHPRMILLYPPDNHVLEIVLWQRYAINYIYNIPEILEYTPSSLPCCNPQNYKVILFNQVADKNILIKKIKFHF